MCQICGTLIDYLGRVYKTFDIAPFFSKLIIGMGDEPSKVVAQINLAHPGLNVEFTSDTGGVTYERFYKPKGKKNERQYIILIFDTDELTPSLVAHEAVHVVNFVYQHVGQKIDKDNDEVNAYHVGWVVDRVYEVKEEAEKQHKPIKKK